MKTLVVYHSLTNNTKKVAEKIAKEMSADIDEIIDEDKLGDKAMGKDVKISYKKDPSEYDIVILGTPVWGFSLPPFMKKYLKKNNFNKVAFFCTRAIWKGILFRQMKKLSGTPLATLNINMKKIENSEEKIKEFCRLLN